MVKSRVIVAMLGILSALPASALTVLTSIKPIQMITHELVLGVGQAEVLLDNNASPHDYALRPSDVRKIHTADLVVWFGEELEPFMSKTLLGLEHERVVTVSQLESISLEHFGDDHVDDGHNHGTLDPHFWLGKQTTLGVATAIAERLSILDSEHSAQYNENLQRFKSNLDKTTQGISARLTPLKASPYYVFHDAYGYFERDYQLNNLGHFTVSPERKPGAKTLVEIKRTLSGIEQVCVFSEPQFQPAVINSVVRGTSAKLGTLDPLGSTIDVADSSYFGLLNDLADEFETCFNSKE